MTNPQVCPIDAPSQPSQSLAELQERALAEGCTLAQFNHATETVGADPLVVTQYLRRHGFMPKPIGLIDGVSD